MVAQIERNTRPGKELSETPQSELRDRTLVFITMGWMLVVMFFPYRPLIVGMVSFWMLVLAAIWISGFRKGAYGGRAASNSLRRAARAWRRWRNSNGR